jgi:hypothetical protein
VKFPSKISTDETEEFPAPPSAVVALNCPCRIVTFRTEEVAAEMASPDPIAAPDFPVAVMNPLWIEMWSLVGGIPGSDASPVRRRSCAENAAVDRDVADGGVAVVPGAGPDSSTRGSTRGDNSIEKNDGADTGDSVPPVAVDVAERVPLPNRMLPTDELPESAYPEPIPALFADGASAVKFPPWNSIVPTLEVPWEP